MTSTMATWLRTVSLCICLLPLSVLAQSSETTQAAPALLLPDLQRDTASRAKALKALFTWTLWGYALQAGEVIEKAGPLQVDGDEQLQRQFIVAEHAAELLSIENVNFEFETKIKVPSKPSSAKRDKAGQTAIEAYRALGRLSQTALEKERLGWQIRALTGEAVAQYLLGKKAAAQTLLSRAAALPGATDNLERARIELVRADIFELQHDTASMVKALAAAVDIIAKRAPDGHPYHATILPSLVRADILSGHTEAAHRRIAEYLTLQVAAPGGATFRGQREAEMAGLLYEAGLSLDAERLLSRAIDTVLSATDDAPAERVKQVETMVESALTSHDKGSVLRASQRVLEGAFVEQYKRLPEYAALVDLLAAKGSEAGAGRIAKAAESLRRPGATLGIDKDPAIKALLNSVHSLPVRQAASLALEQARASGTARAPNELIFLLETALERVNAEVGLGSELSTELVDALTSSFVSAQLPAKSMSILLKQSDAIIAVEGRDHNKSSLWHLNAAEKFRRMGNPRHADDMISRSIREETLGFEIACRKLALEDFNRQFACKRAAKGRAQLGEINAAVGLLLGELATYHPGGARARLSLATMYAGQTEEALYEVLGRSTLGSRRDDFFDIETDGTPSKANVVAICAALPAGRVLDPLPANCTIKQPARGTPATDIDAERQRLLQAAVGDPQTLPSQGHSGDPLEYTQRLRQWAEETGRPLDRRRLALLLAWDVRMAANPRNEVTEAELAVDLANLYAADVPELAAALLARGLPAAIAAGAQAPIIKDRLIKLANALRKHAPEQIASLTTLLIGQLDDTRVAQDENLAVHLSELELGAVRTASAADRMAAFERVQTRLARVRSFLREERTDLRLETFVRLLVVEAREAQTSASAVGVDKLLQRMAAAQARLGVGAGAIATVAAARAEISDLAGTAEELPRLMQVVDSGLAARNANAALLPQKTEEVASVQRARSTLAENQRKLQAVLSGRPPTWGNVVDHYVAVVASAVQAQEFNEAHAQIVRVTARVLRERAETEDFLVDPFEEIKFWFSSLCRVDNGELVASSSLLPGRLHACGQAMSALARERLLLRVLSDALSRDGRRVGTQSVTTANLLDEYLEWRAAIAPRFEPDAAAFHRVTLGDLDFARSARSYLGQEAGRPRERSNFLLITAGRGNALRNAAQREVGLLNQEESARSARIGEIAGALGPSEAVVVMHQSASVLYRWVILSNRVSAFQDRVDRSQLRTLIARLRDAFLSMDKTALPEIRVSDHYAVFDLLWAPLQRHLQGKTQVWIVPNGPLALVPFPALVTQSPREPVWRSTMASWRPAWLVEQYGTALVRSLRDFRIDRVPFNEPADQLPYIGLGNPVLGNPEADAPDACIAGIPLPGVAQELIRAGRAMGSERLLVGQDFTSRGVEREALERYRIILIATHAIHPGMPSCRVQEPALVLSRDAQRPNLLYSSDLQRWNLSAQVVILAACESGADDLQREDRPIGALANALLDSGARTAIVATWPVLSAHSADVTTPVMEALAKDRRQTPASALRSTMLSLLASPDTAARHPAVWAAFFSIGGL